MYYYVTNDGDLYTALKPINPKYMGNLVEITEEEYREIIEAREEAE